MDLPVMPPLAPMLAKSTPSLPEAEPGRYWFEPKWDGFRCLVFRDGDEIELGSRNDRPLTRYFPELLEPLRRALPERCVVDGEIVVAGPDGLDFDALQQRIHPAGRGADQDQLARAPDGTRAAQRCRTLSGRGKEPGNPAYLRQELPG